MNSILFLVALAFAPGIYLAVAIYGRDKYDREPKMILLKAFLLGCLSIIPAAIIEIVLKEPLDFPELGIWNVAIHAFVGVALVEELAKFVMLRFHAYRLPDFNEPFDGIVYAAFVGLGFATAENVLYVLQGGWGVGVMRMFTSVPAHYAFAVIMGYYVGKAKFEPQHRMLHMTRGVFYATFMHGAYDFFLMQKSYPALAILTIGVLLMSLRISRRAVEELHADSVFRFHSTQVNQLLEPHERSGF
ncbi:MAG: PrsW family intramembrane metalloprotease [Chitinophagales bacterium]|nr:PrsW family intramembrane metalloprotease [Chitinophagales bacterium]